MAKHSPLLASVSQNPLLIDESAQDVFQSSLQHVMSHPEADKLMVGVSASNDDNFWGDDNDPDDWLHYYRPYAVIDGVLQIPVMGVLLSQFPWQLGRWATGYKYIEMALRRGLEDPNVKGIALLINSPGGEVTECFELTDKIFEWRDEKPIRAFAANWAYSAAFAIASATGRDNLMVTRSGGVGSVGVVTAHVEYSEYMKDAGIKVTFIFAGDHKVDGNPYEKLSDAAKKRIQGRIDKIYGVFTSTVARNRGMDEDEVRATKALTYDAEEAIEIGFADRIGALEEEMVVFATEVADTGDEFMAIQGNTTGKKPVGQDDNAQGYSQEQVDAMVADARAEGHAEGVKAEGSRITEIMGCDEAKTRPAAAAMLVELGVDASVAKAKLAKMPEETKAEATPAAPAANAVTGKTAKAEDRNHFAEMMDKTKNPEIGANVEDEDETSPQAQTNSILSAFGMASGRGRKKSAA